MYQKRKRWLCCEENKWKSSVTNLCAQNVLISKYYFTHWAGQIPTAAIPNIKVNINLVYGAINRSTVLYIFKYHHTYKHGHWHTQALNTRTCEGRLTMLLFVYNIPPGHKENVHRLSCNIRPTPHYFIYFVILHSLYLSLIHI